MRRANLLMLLAVIPPMLVGGCASPERLGFAYRAQTYANDVQLLVDETWVDESGSRHVEQEIFDSVFEVIDDAERFILLDFFLANDFGYDPGPGMRPLSQEITDRLIAKRQADPEVRIIFITDPINRVYGSVDSPQFESLQESGVEVVWTDLDKLRDSNPLYSKPWRLLIKPWGVGPGNTVENPLGDGRISLRSLLKLLNFKANHRKLVVTEKSLLVTSANPHSASSAHWNVALRIDGAGMALGCEAEAPIMRFSVVSRSETAIPKVAANDIAAEEGHLLEVLTEIRIQEKALEMLKSAEPDARIDLSMFYLSDHDIIDAVLEAAERGCAVRVILDPNKDAFGRTKNGIPNRQTAIRLVEAGIPVRWAATHGEQFHVKMLYVERPDQTATVLLGSSNFTRRNLENINAECNAAFTAPLSNAVMVRARGTFDRWWSNPEGRTYTADYAVYADPSRWRRVRAWFMEVTGMSSF